MSFSSSVARGNSLSSFRDHFQIEATKPAQHVNLPEETPNGELCRAIANGNWQEARTLLSYRGNTRLLEQHLMNQRCTALHMACIWDAPIDIVLSLIYIYDDACLMQNVDGRTPLSFACECASDEIIFLLIKACPRAVFVRDNNGSLPLRDAVWFGKGLHTIEMLLQLYPSSVTSPNVHGTSALDEFFKEGIFNYKDMRRVIDVSSLLLQASTGRCKFDSDASGRKRPWNILHASIIEPRVPWAFTVFFFEKHSHQITEKDENGNLPLHLLCFSSKPFNDKVIDTLFKAFPGALSVKNNMGLTPLDIALLRKHIQRDENFIQSGTEASRNGSVVDDQSDSDRENELMQINTIFWLLLKDPSIVSQFEPRLA